MFKNYLKIGWRSLKRQPFFTFLNTFGLAIGMAGALLIVLYIYDELNYDNMFADANRIHRAQVDIKFGGQAREFAVTPAILGPTIVNDFPEVEAYTRFRAWGSMLVRKEGTQKNVKESQTSFVDTSFFTMFGLDLLEGDSKTALKEPNTLILTKSAAEKHFNLNNAVGQTVVLNNDQTYTVTGVVDDFPKNSFLRDQSVLMAMEGFSGAKNPEWGGNNFNTFFKLSPEADIEDFQPKLQSLFITYVIPYVQDWLSPGLTVESFHADGNYLRYSTVPLKDLHLSSNRISELSPNSDMQTIYILSFIGLFLIVLASVNFMNLSTAHSLKRAKEVGVRKTLGSNKSDLVQQFLTESGLITFLSLLLALIVSAIALPFFNQLADKAISIPYLNPLFWLVVLVVTLILGFISGSYPAFFMSRFRPSKVLKGSGQSSVGGNQIRNGLVIFQFAISVFLIVSTLVVYQQLKYIQNKDLGYSKEQVVVIDDVFAAGNQMQSFKKDVLRIAQVKEATLSSYLPTPSNRSDNVYNMVGASEQDKDISMQRWRVDHDYVKTLNLQLIAGRDFDRQFGTDSTAIIVNERAVTLMGVSPLEAIGKKVTLEDSKSEVFTIVGVLKNFHYSSMKDDIGALNLYLGDTANSMAVQLASGDFANTLKLIESKWNEVAPGQPFNYYFMDEAFNETYAAEKRLGSIFITFTILSILIACLGLFGLAAFNAEKRTKEIGVRKVLGASVSQISYRLTLDFLRLVGIGIIISLPIGWLTMNKWLEDFSYRIEIPWWVFVLSALLAIGIAILTVSYQSIKAAVVDPVKSLRTE